MKKIILVALVLIAINAQAQSTLAIAHADAPLIVHFYEEKLECEDPYTGGVNNECMDVHRARDLDRQYGMENMTDAQKKAVLDIMEPVLKDQEKNQK
jgi:hypothetical protein